MKYYFHLHHQYCERSTFKLFNENISICDIWWYLELVDYNWGILKGLVLQVGKMKLIWGEFLSKNSVNELNKYISRRP